MNVGIAVRNNLYTFIGILVFACVAFAWMATR